ncbi:Imm7 family immunity protein [Paenibacillus nuruki]|uniref:Imm7 family immunity protein n=1 Tax=Paenibacillus nuruki TaxID=1886670 RepID=UPI0028057CE5|nr:Imm7 family immunity protein [Paenibacillus nuruki]CAJ1317055.1 Immunity protein 7 of polymorphic toxin system [Paenibacillus nuruki]
MYQYHGWAVISQSVDDEINDKEDHKVLLKVQNYISQMKDNINIIEVKAINGQYHFLITGFSNHKILSKYNPITILRRIGEIAPGSYGILYVYDDEDEVYFNEFRVYVLTRGYLAEKQDPFLSPLIPTIANRSEFDSEN